MRRLALAAFCGLAGCGGDGVVGPPAGGSGTQGGSSSSGGGGEGEPLVDGPRIERVMAVSTPGSSVFVQTDAPIEGVELRLDGRRLATPPIVAGGGAGDRYGGLFALPPELGPGTSQLRVRAAGAAADSDSATLELVPPTFVDVAEATGLLQKHDVTDHPEQCAWSSTGLGFGDYDNDGDSDLYVGNVGESGRMLRNDGDQDGDGLPDYVRVTQELGLLGIDDVSSVSFMDYDNDGDRDLFVGRRGIHALMQNRLVEDGAPGFVDVTAAVGLVTEPQRTMGVAWGDYDGDGDLDLYVVNHAWCFPRPGNPLLAEDHLYRNDGGVFTEVTPLLAGAPADVVQAVGFSAVWIDHDRDGDQDLIVINDHIADLSGPNALWRNDGPGAAPGEWRFTSAGESSGVAIPANSNGEGVNGMGLAIGDVDRDGWPDLAFSNIGPNYLLLNQRDGTFKDAGEDMGVRRGLLAWQSRSVTWGTHLLDYDNDADLDLYFAGGAVHDRAQIPDALLRNDDGHFVDVTWAAGLHHIGSGKASALVDLDQDGWLEFATAHWADRLRVYHNQRREPERHWLAVDLVGTSSNRDALGSVVAVETPDGATQTCFRTPNPSLGAGGELTCHFGLGDASEVTRLTITWPDGQVTELDPPDVDTRVRVVQ